MRFFLEFVSCCASPTGRATEPTVSAEEEDRWLVPAPVVSAAPSRRKKQKRMGAPDWRPSLGSISEDIAVPPREPLNGAVASAGKKTGSAGGGAAKVYHRSYSDGYNRSVKKLVFQISFNGFHYLTVIYYYQSKSLMQPINLRYKNCVTAIILIDEKRLLIFSDINDGPVDAMLVQKQVILKTL